jgi:Caspase domain
MQRDRAIFIGINTYLERQALKCAQQDAVCLYQWWTQEALRDPELALLSTDSSPRHQGHSTTPTMENLRFWLDQIKPAIAATDRLWIFFSGYGESLGGKDYLLPVDATPGDETTRSPGENWIALEEVYPLLQALPTQDILLILDTNRSQSVWADHGLGDQTQTLAQHYGIPTLLSCQPKQFSHESPAFGQGLFTLALLEGLRNYPGQPLQTLVDFLIIRLPELSEHNNRPAQVPMAIATMAQLAGMMVPGAPMEPGSLAPRGLGELPLAGGLDQPSVELARETLETPGALAPQVIDPPLPSPGPLRTEETQDSEALTLDAIEQGAVPSQFPSTSVKPHPRKPSQAIDTPMDKARFWQQILALSALIALVLGLSAVLRRNLPPEAAQNLLVPAPNSPEPAKPSPMPTAASPDPSPRLDVPVSPPADSARILEDARAKIKPTNGEELRQAIDYAQQIPPGDPRRPETERQINRWSRDILQLANQRASQGKYREAVSLAALVPKGPSYDEAQKSTAQWKTKVR